MDRVPGGLVDSQSRPRAAQVTRRTDWYVIEKARFEYVGSGELSRADLVAVEADLPEGIFVAVRTARSIEQVLKSTKWGTFGTRRLSLASKIRDADHPKVAWVARGARLAVLPHEGAVWVDSERLFTAGEAVPLPWTRPRVELPVVRPKALRQAIAYVLPGSSSLRATSIFDEPGGGAD